MTCRDDYPRLAWIEQWDTDDGPECRRALDELDHLRGDVSKLLTMLATVEANQNMFFPPPTLAGSSNSDSAPGEAAS